MQKSLKWTPAQPQRKPDNIISSKARETGDLTGFIPTYLSEKHENMRFIMSNEYMRKWFKERGTYEKNTYSKEESIKEESKIKRRFVQRMMTYKKPNKLELLEQIQPSPLMKKFQALADSNTQAAEYRKLKYKPVCSKQNKNEAQLKVKKTGQTKDKISNNKAETNTAAECSTQPVILCPVTQICAPCCPGK